MKTAILTLFSFLILVSCNNQNENASHSENKKDATPRIIKNTFAKCFDEVDTSKTSESSACSSRAFKIIGDEFVLGISAYFPVQFDSCYSVMIDSSNAKKMGGLLIFKKGKANLNNICTDITNSDNPEPIEHLTPQSGEFIIGFTKDKGVNGTFGRYVTILVKHIVFIDDKTGKKYEFENELFWKVLDVGTPG
jgi:hypothetical protein